MNDTGKLIFLVKPRTIFLDIIDRRTAVIRMFRIPRDRRMPQYNVLRVSLVPWRNDCGLMYHAAAADINPRAVAVTPVLEIIAPRRREERSALLGLLRDIMTKLMRKVHAISEFFIFESCF